MKIAIDRRPRDRSVLRVARRVFLVLVVSLAIPSESSSQQRDTSSGVKPLGQDSISVRMVDLDVRSAVMLLARYLDRPLMIGNSVTGGRVSLEANKAIARRDVPRLLRSLVESQSLRFEFDSAAGVYRVDTPPVVISPAPTAVPDPSSSRNRPYSLWVIPLRHARAVTVAATISALYGRASAFGELGSRSTTLSDQLRRSQLEPQIPQQSPSSRAAASVASDGTSQPGALSSDIAIVPDENTNSLLVRGTANDHDLVLAAVRAVDTRPLQVLIEILIAEVRKDRSLSYGLDVSVPATKVPSTAVTASGTQSGTSLGDFVLTVMRRGSPNIDGVLRAAASRGDARILSRPILVAANNQQAEILVGSQRPFVQVQRSLPTNAPSRDQVVQYRDVGTRLAVRPTISTDGFVALEITQEVNAATAETQFDAPVISTRNVQTKIVVRDSQTIVLGGLTDQQREATQGGIPFLSSIPWVGGLFGRASRRSTETEFFLFLTIRILHDDDDVKRATTPIEERARKGRP